MRLVLKKDKSSDDHRSFNQFILPLLNIEVLQIDHSIKKCSEPTDSTQIIKILLKHKKVMQKSNIAVQH